MNFDHRKFLVVLTKEMDDSERGNKHALRTRAALQLITLSRKVSPNGEFFIFHCGGHFGLNGSRSPCFIGLNFNPPMNRAIGFSTLIFV